MNEAQFTKLVIDLAAMYGWHVTHFRPAQMKSGKWATPLQGDAGFPDLVLVHDALGGGVIFAELKVGNNRLSAGQQQWIDRLQNAKAETYVWRPHDLDTINRRLQRRHNIPKET